MLRIKEIINEKHLTYREIADRMNVSPQYISNIANGHANATIQVIEQIAKILNEPPAALFEGYTHPQTLPDSSKSFCPFCGHTLKIGRGE